MPPTTTTSPTCTTVNLPTENFHPSLPRASPPRLLVLTTTHFTNDVGKFAQKAQLPRKHHHHHTHPKHHEREVCRHHQASAGTATGERARDWERHLQRDRTRAILVEPPRKELEESQDHLARASPSPPPCLHQPRPRQLSSREPVAASSLASPSVRKQLSSRGASLPDRCCSKAAALQQPPLQRSIASA